MIMGLLLVFTVSCGSSGGSDGAKGSGDKSGTTIDQAGAPDLDAIAKGMQNGLGLSESQAMCAAKKIQGKLSAKALRAVANAKGSEVPASEGDEATKQLAKAVAECP